MTNLLSNRAAAHFHDRKWEEAKRDAELVIKWRPDWIKVSIYQLFMQVI
jgi:hypothetical protein